MLTEMQSLTPSNQGMESPLPCMGVMCFFQDVIEKLHKQKKLIKIGKTICELGTLPVIPDHIKEAVYL